MPGERARPAVQLSPSDLVRLFGSTSATERGICTRVIPSERSESRDLQFAVIPSERSESRDLHLNDQHPFREVA